MMAGRPRPQPFAFLNFSGWEGGRVDFQKRGQDEMVICLGWEGGRVDFQKWSKQRWGWHMMAGWPAAATAICLGWEVGAKQIW